MGDDLRDDVTLLTAAARGDDRAFGVLVRRHIRQATLLAAQWLGDRDEAEDVVQEAFAIVYSRAHQFDRERVFPPWIFGIVRRLAFNRRVRDARRLRIMRRWGRGNDPPVDHGRAEQILLTAVDADAALRAIELLSPMQRACFELVAVRDVSPADAAAMHGIAESTVRQHVFRARRMLQRTLDPHRDLLPGNEGDASS